MKTNPQRLSGCHSCGGSVHEIPMLLTDWWVTSDCRPWPICGTLASCGQCGLVQKIVSDKWLESVSRVYAGYKMYSQSGGIDQAAFDASGNSDSRSQKIIEWLKKNSYMPNVGALLDVGCGNGAFLRSFGKALPGWRMTGVELDERNKYVIESIRGVELFHAGRLEDVPGTFDLISLIHVIEHVPNPRDFIACASKKLRPNGKILIQVPDIERSPFDLLIIDHCSHFSRGTICSLASDSGLFVDYLASDCIAKELTVLLSFSPTFRVRDERVVKGLVDRKIASNHIHWLGRVLRSALSESGSIGIFGSSIAASWLAGAIGLSQKVSFFLDEDAHRIGRIHLDLPILGISSAPRNQPIFMPLSYEFALAVSGRLTDFSLNLVLPPRHHPLI